MFVGRYLESAHLPFIVEDLWIECQGLVLVSRGVASASEPSPQTRRCAQVCGTGLWTHVGTTRRGFLLDIHYILGIEKTLTFRSTLPSSS